MKHDLQISAERSAMMRAVRGKDTKPELAVRQTLHRLGFRFRLHRKDLPGRPDIVLPRHRLAIFVHGCFWHRHAGCKRASSPKTRSEFWNAKFEANVARDDRVQCALQDAGWKVLIVWECAARDVEALERMLLGVLKKH